MTEDAEHRAIVEMWELLKTGDEPRAKRVFPEKDWKKCLVVESEVTISSEEAENFEAEDESQME